MLVVSFGGNNLQSALVNAAHEGRKVAMAATLRVSF